MRIGFTILIGIGLLFSSTSMADPSSLQSLLHGRLGREATVVVFLGASCPVSNRYIPRLNQLASAYSKQGVAFIGFNSNPGETALQTALHAVEYEIAFPVYKDVHQKTATYFNASRTPQVFVLNKQSEIVYQGRVDGQYGVGHATLPTQGRFDLKEALDETLTGKTVSIAHTAAEGCEITLKPDSSPPVTYSRDISRIIQNRCQTCHRSDGVAEFYPWMNYDQVSSMAAMIKQVVAERRMPPWHADPRYGVFSNDRSISPEEMNTIIEWVDAGAPEGNPDELPEPREYPKLHFSIGEPDRILYLPQEFTVPADGVVDYQYFILDEETEEDMWIQSAEAIMDSPAVHHIILFFMPPHEDNKKRDRHMLVGTAPGDMPLKLPEGTAIFVPKGSRFLIEMHYTPIGREVTDRSYIGLIEATAPVEKAVYGNPLGRQDFLIPAGAENHKEISRFKVHDDIEVISFTPHMHVRGKSWKYTAVLPDGKEQILLNVPRYDFNWQSVYRYLEKPILPKGATLICEAVWDNSANNPYNPDPTQPVGYGEQTWEEMMFGFIQYVHVNQKTAKTRTLSRIKSKP